MKFKLKVLKVTSKNYFCQAMIGNLPVSGLIGLYPQSDIPTTLEVGNVHEVDIPQGFKLVVEDRVVDKDTAETRPFFAVDYAG